MPKQTLITLAKLNKQINHKARQAAQDAAFKVITETENIELPCDVCGKPESIDLLFDCDVCGALCLECGESCDHGLSAEDLAGLAQLETEDRTRQAAELSRRWLS